MGGEQYLVPDQNQDQYIEQDANLLMKDMDSMEMPSHQNMRSTTRNEMHHKTTGRLYATTTRTGGYPQTNDDSNVSPLSTKKRQRSQQNESAFAGALTDT